MADDSSDKTEEPTQKKIQDARERGQVAVSREFSKVGSVICLVMCMIFASHYYFKEIANNFLLIIQNTQDDIGMSKVYGIAMQSIKVALTIICLPIFMASVISVMFTLLQLGGVVINKEFFKIDFNKLNPVNNFKSIYGKKNLIKTLRIIIEMIVVLSISFFIVRNSLATIFQLYQANIFQAWWIILIVVGKLCAVYFAVLLVFGLVDFVLEKRNLRKQLMMSMSELKQEFKNTEGDPEVKGRRKEMHRELLEDDGESLIENASLVLANPTHYAVVILYRPKVLKLPVVIFKAKNDKAQRVFALARKHNVLIVRDKWVARKLYSLADVGQYVPQSLLPFVADIIGKNLHLLTKVVQEIKETVASPAKPGDVPVVKPTKSVVPLQGGNFV